MIGASTLIFISIWFYKSAEKLRLPLVPWLVGGVLVYYSCYAAWMYLVLKPMLGMSFREHSLPLALFINISSVLVGLAMAALFRAKVMVPKGQAADQGQV
jgi:hypothetical protein